MIQLVVRAIIPRKNKYLLVQNKPSGIWCLPGGKVDPGEPIVRALERELVEELGVRPIVGQLLYVQQLSLPDMDERIEFFFLINNPESYESIDVTQTTHGQQELSDAGFYRLKDVPVRPHFLVDELPALLKNYTPGILPHFRIGT